METNHFTMLAHMTDVSKYLICENCLHENHKTASSQDRVDVLKKRLANEEITVQEYLRLKSIIENN